MTFGGSVTPMWFSTMDHFTSNMYMFARTVGTNATAASDLYSSGRALYWTSAGNAVQLCDTGRPGGGTGPRVVTGCWMKLGTLGGSMPDPGIALISHGDLSRASGSRLSRSIVLGANRSLEVWSQFDNAGARTKVANTSNNVLPVPGTWFRLEAEEITANTSTSNDGVANINIDTVSALSTGTLPDQWNNGTFPIVGPIVTNGAGTGVEFYLDECYYMADAGTPDPAVNDFLGSWRTERMRPSGQGSYSQFTLQAGSSHWGAVRDDAENDGATSYLNATSVAGSPPYTSDTYTYPALLSSSGTVIALTAWECIRAGIYGRFVHDPWDEAETQDRFAQQVYLEWVGASPSNSTWIYMKRYMGTSRATAAAWTISQLNALKMGMMAVAGLDGFTQFGVEALIQNPVYARPQSRIAIVG